MKHQKHFVVLVISIISIFFIACENGDTISPIVAITNPIDGSVVHETVNIIISVSDNSKIDDVQLLIDGIKVTNLVKENDLFKYSWETYSIENGTEHTLIARATDSEGNTGQSDIIAVTVNNEGFSPQSVILQPPVVSGSNITLNWSASNDADFDHYELLRTYAEVDTYSVVFSDTSSQKVVFTDSVIQNTSYEYYIKVFDKAGLFSESNHQVVEYVQFLPPIPQNFSAIVNGSFIEISWNPIDISDFGKYIILKKTTNISQIDSIVIEQMSKSSYSDSVSQINEYEYSLIAFDDFGNYSTTDKVPFSVSDFQPETPTMYNPIIDGSNIALKWSRNTDVDFQSYQIFRSQNGSEMELINQIQAKDDTTYVDEVTQGLSYLYLVTVNDNGGLLANSNTISISAVEFNPTPVQLLSVELNGDIISLEWSQNTDTDFNNYRIEQSIDSGEYENLIEIPERTTLIKSFSVEQYRNYSYKIICVDVAALEVESNILQIEKERFLPSEVNLLSVDLSGDVITLDWNYSPDVDFQKFEIIRNNITISELTDSLENSFKDTVTQGLDYSYQIEVYDIADLKSFSNIKTIYAGDFLPSDVILTSINLSGDVVTLNWNYSKDVDFLKYEVIRNGEIIDEITDYDNKTYDDTVVQGVDYDYQIKVIDTGELENSSNTKTILADEFYPPRVEISNISYNGVGILIKWTPTNIPDFHSIEIIRATDSLFTDKTVIETISDKNQNEYVDYSIETENSRYFYKLEIVDTGNLSTISNWKYLSFFDEIMCIDFFDNNSKPDLLLVECDGYNKRPIIFDLHLNYFDVSPDGKFALMNDNSQWLLIDIYSESSKIIMNEQCWIGRTKIMWTGDNKKVYFFDAYQIFEYDVNSNTLNHIVGAYEPNEYIYEMYVSEGSGKVVYNKLVYWQEWEARDVFVYFDGAHQNITNTGGEPTRWHQYYEENPIINYNGSVAYYVRQGILWKNDLNSNTETQFMIGYGWYLSEAIFSRDGNHLYISWYQPSGDYTYGLYDINMNDGIVTKMYDGKVSLQDISPDGDKILFNSEESGDQIIMDRTTYQIETQIPVTLKSKARWVKNRWSSN